MLTFGACLLAITCSAVQPVRADLGECGQSQSRSMNRADSFGMHLRVCIGRGIRSNTLL